MRNGFVWTMALIVVFVALAAGVLPAWLAENASGLAEDIRYAGRGVTSVEERELWNMPIILISLMGLVCAEWGYRRLVGLA